MGFRRFLSSSQTGYMTSIAERLVRRLCAGSAHPIPTTKSRAGAGARVPGEYTIEPVDRQRGDTAMSHREVP
jgi:hypothetical protein